MGHAKNLTEIGRKIGIISAASSFMLVILAGVFSNSDILWTCIMGVIGGLVFGGGGLMIGNLTEKYVRQAAQRELARRAMERKIMEELAMEQAMAELEETPLEEVVESAG